MLTTPISCVVDASVGIKLVVAEPDSAIVHALFAHLALDPAARSYVPDLFFVECANVLRRLTKRGLISPAAATAGLATLVGLPLIEFPMKDLAEDALAFAQQFDITAYDAAYAVVAVRMNVPLVTADDPLRKKLGAGQCVALLLGSLTIPAPPAAPATPTPPTP